MLGLGFREAPIRRRVSLLFVALAGTLACTDPHRSGTSREDAGSARDGSAAQTPDAQTSAQQDPAYLFDPDQLRTFELRLREEDLAFLDADPKAEQYVPGELLFEGERIELVGIRYKGSFGSFVGCLAGSSFPPSGAKTCPKLSLKIKIDYGDRDARFYRQKKLVFHAMNTDRSLLRERLGYGLFQEMGVNASRTVHVRLLINGQLSGLYLLVEDLDSPFTHSRFADGGHGNLYKEAWPASDDEAFYRAALETNSGDDTNVDKMLAFARALRAADDDELPTVLARWVDLDNLARYVAVDRTIRHDDGPYHWYCQAATVTGSADWHRQEQVGDSYCGNHNYYWYEETRADRMWLIPWDLDNALPARPSITLVQSAWDDLSRDCSMLLPAPLGAQLPVTCDPLLRAVALGQADRVRAAMRELLSGPMSETSTHAKLTRWATQIAPVVNEASALYPREPSPESWQSEVTSLESGLDRLRSEAATSAGL